MPQSLQGKKIAILITDGFEEIEMTEPRRALQEAGADIEIVSPAEGRVKAWHTDHWGGVYPLDVPLDQASPENYDALLLPGGVMNPDKLRVNPTAVRFAKHFLDEAKPIAAICHGPWLLVETGRLKGRKVTSWPSLKTDIQNAGAHWTDAEVVVDNGLVTSRKPEDLPAFNRKMLEEFAEGSHASRIHAASRN